VVLILHFMMSTQAIDDAGHDKAVKLKVRGLEAVDRAIGQLARLLWEAEKSGHYQYFLCVTGDHSTPVEYGDHSFEPIPFAICRLRDFVGAIGEVNVMNTPLDDFPLPSVKSGEDLTDSSEPAECKPAECKAFSGDAVCEYTEIAAARGCLGRFPGSEMMGIIKKFMKAKND
jgi:2,3-bisphosphoglycerate-independent phosphoglycerate mutase